ncbi:MAG: thiol:disulfide interchange protein DsbA/DsbL [Hydrogenophaga sp.]|jgi:thiol:disulfide interchange protein DsbA|uniref:thiol:disulfide interchange protein DsbA/DsbL n=1 Tax=Hydrogenophaga sp. TaxID=1904254 RepID=UPI002721BA98|nr:thiol:disulfide interchange protein DsbA/DsbL [Hydrogenophaga sp.]MDO9200853.1 thiol:disulfide interchange protein DsbA/DsbL [Hydrogenophaga sp.]MDO9481308.1 thiol:disulfide interchange protein DsbA/DsbL [Hydrogenophaga sp.]MDO9572176.1 thiol:disulfide interchange protein DsbA/DsbL [Hydrogenophaga sp.]MDP1893160.1 thiol:disulfide interchange protein DsbA/DsbL [Hydrogenophaga sp.]MDP2094474.1 thiol:disulfide interchange protein DsbA/DsbL [Hydrogenophaga sp.]
MQRREFSRSLLAAGATTALGATAALTLTPAHAQLAGLKEGADFVRLGRPAPVDSPTGKIEVLEFFAYTCIHCYNFEPLLSDWMKKAPAHVVVRRTPVAFNDAFVPLQRLYYALDAMGQVDALHEKVFRAIHVDKQRLNSSETITAWVTAQGVDREKFTGFFNSFAVAGKARRATQMQDAYQVEGTPSLGVGGRYYVTGQGPRTLVVANALIDDLRKA